MAERYRTPDDWTVEVVQVAAGDRLRIRHHGFYVADVVNVDDLARWIPGRRARAAGARHVNPGGLADAAPGCGLPV